MGSGDSYRKDSMAGSSVDEEENQNTHGVTSSRLLGTEEATSKTKGTTHTVTSTEVKRQQEEKKAE